jgi:hypothetical protein
VMRPRGNRAEHKQPAHGEDAEESMMHDVGLRKQSG